MHFELFTLQKSRIAGFLCKAFFRACAKIFTSWRNIHLWIERQCFRSGWAQIKLSWHFLPDIWVCRVGRGANSHIISHPTSHYGERDNPLNQFKHCKSHRAQLKVECISNRCPALADLFPVARVAVERKAFWFFCQDIFPLKINPCSDFSSVPCCCLFFSFPLHFSPAGLQLPIFPLAFFSLFFPCPSASAVIMSKWLLSGQMDAKEKL